MSYASTRYNQPPKTFLLLFDRSLQTWTFRRRDPLLLSVYARWAQAAEDKHFLMLAARCHLAAFQVREKSSRHWLGVVVITKLF
jgi:hypothetical protein